MRQRSSKAPTAAPPHDALDTCLRLLARRAHSRAELALKLRRRGHEPEAIETALGRVAELGYLDDPAFARSLVRRRSAIRGPLALSAELAARGVDRAEAAAAVAEFDLAAQVRSATQLAERLFARKPVAGYRAMLNAVGSKLMRRGFSAPVVRAACRAVLSGAAASDDD